MINVFKVTAKDTPLYFYCTSYLSARQKYNRLARDNRMYLEGRRPYAGKYKVLGLPLIDLESVITYETLPECNKYIEEQRARDPDNCLNKPSFTYGSEEYKKSHKNKFKYVTCETCHREYRSDYILQHYTKKNHKKRLGLSVDELSE